MLELVNSSKYGEFFDRILDVDKKVRFAAIHDGQFKGKYQKGVSEYSTDDEIKLTLSEAHQRWDSRQKESFRIGEPKFAMAQYEKINRITIPLRKEGIILITTEIDADIKKIIDEIIEIRIRLLD